MVIENEKTNQNSISELDNVDINILPSVNSIESENQIFNESNKMIDLLSASTNLMNYNIESINVSKEIKSKTVEKTQEWEIVNDDNDLSKSKKTFGIKITTAINVIFVKNYIKNRIIHYNQMLIQLFQHLLKKICLN